MLEWCHLIFLAVAISLDNMVICIVYGCNKVRVSIPMLLMMDLCGCLVTAAFMGLGSWCGEIISRDICKAISFSVLFFMGFWKLRESLKQYLYHRRGYADKKAAVSQLTLTAAFTTALALSVDGALIGFGLALEQGNCPGLLLLVLPIDFFFAQMGLQIGAHLSQKVSWNWSWLEGVIFLILAFTKL